LCNHSYQQQQENRWFKNQNHKELASTPASSLLWVLWWQDDKRGEIRVQLYSRDFFICWCIVVLPLMQRRYFMRRKNNSLFRTCLIFTQIIFAEKE
jgi:hypothetical protein